MNAVAKQSNVAEMNHGRQGSSAVRCAIHEPLMPRSTNTNGTTQHTEALTAASIARQMAGREDLDPAVLMRAY